MKSRVRRKRVSFIIGVVFFEPKISAAVTAPPKNCHSLTFCQQSPESFFGNRFGDLPTIGSSGASNGPRQGAVKPSKIQALETLCV